MSIVTTVGIVFSYLLPIGIMFWWQEKKIRSRDRYIKFLEGMVLHLSLHRDIVMFIENGEEEPEE